MACFSQNGGEFFPKTFFQKTDTIYTIPYTRSCWGEYNMNKNYDFYFLFPDASGKISKRA